MACAKCTMRLVRPPKRPRIALPFYRQFHASPQHQRLGAFTYAQEWQTGTYHYNKSLSKTLPVAAQRTDDLLTAYATQQKRRIDASNPLYAQITRANIASQRRQPDRVLISKATAKDFGDRVELTAWVYDGVGAAEAEREAFRQRRMGVKAGEAKQAGRRGPATARRRAVGQVDGSVAPATPSQGPRRTNAFGAPQGRMTGFRNQQGPRGGSGQRSTAGGAAGGRSGPPRVAAAAAGSGTVGGNANSIIRRVTGPPRGAPPVR